MMVGPTLCRISALMTYSFFLLSRARGVVFTACNMPGDGVACSIPLITALIILTDFHFAISSSFNPLCFSIVCQTDSFFYADSLVL